MVGLGAPGGVSNTSVARACSADGQRVAGNGETLASPSESILWSGTSLAVLGDLPGGAHQSEAWDITPDGRTIVGQGAVVGGNAAFRWTDPATGGIGFESLGDLPGGSVECLAKAVSADGSVVVGYGTTSSGLRAFIWTEAAGMQLLEKALADQGLALNGWTLSLANDVSADGLTIVGRGEDPFGVVRGWVAQLAPETPDMWTDLGQGLAGLRGTPQLEGSGVVLGGSSFTLTVSGALQFAPPVWVVGLTALGAPFKGGTLVPQPDLIFGGNPTGDFSLTSTWPVGMPTPPELYFQFWIHDPGGPAGFAATNAVKASMP